MKFQQRVMKWFFLPRDCLVHLSPNQMLSPDQDRPRGTSHTPQPGIRQGQQLCVQGMNE